MGTIEEARQYFTLTFWRSLSFEVQQILLNNSPDSFDRETVIVYKTLLMLSGINDFTELSTILPKNELRQVS